MDEELFTRFVETQERFCESLGRCSSQIMEVMARSESHMQPAVDSISNLARVVETLTAEYSNHLSGLTKCRDELARQNAILLKQHEEDRSDIQHLREEQRAYSSQLLSLVAELSRSQNGVKIENKM